MKIRSLITKYILLVVFCSAITILLIESCKEVETQEEFFERMEADSLKNQPQGLLSMPTGTKDLYIMTGHIPGVYKIGRSNNPKRRVKEIDYLINKKTDEDVWLVKVYPHQGHLESKIHKLFREQDAHLKYYTGTSSTEWFRFTLDDLCEIDRIILNQ